ncbi:sulfotransferase [Candidatus Borrarchaeum sp.]|uniref:sulfotransferase family protein n=1 Tax=Candidatus Borrarchaeum sp. TaxID=2846742 RepID=UPI002580F2F3|nr:sulfotransferase [Candidatus Borrarchaeum sp.]
MLPNFLIIGAQRSATTFVHKCLEDHPDIFMPPKEKAFFENPYFFQKDFNEFEKLFENLSQKAIGIKRPNYLGKIECPERIYRYIPNAKLIVILRNPVERAISAYFHQMKSGFIPIKPLEKGLLNVINRKYYKLYPRSKEIIEFGFYYKHLMHYLHYFKKDQLLVIIYRDLKANPLKTIQHIFRFLKVDENFIPKTLQSKQNPGVYSLTRLRLLNIRHRFVSIYNEDKTARYGKKQKTVLDRLIDKLILLIDRKLLFQICKNSRLELSAKLSRSLFKIYEEDINGLEVFLGRKLTYWKSYSLMQDVNK